jgi:hypothetical protein
MNFRMFESCTGIDVVRAQHLDLTGGNISSFEMIEVGNLLWRLPPCSHSFAVEVPRGLRSST